MRFTGTRAEWHRTRRDNNPTPSGVPVAKGEWMSTGDDPECSPTSFLIEMPARLEIPSHFHRNNQFQVAVRGTGSLGPHPLRSVTVHYAGAYTGYGPLRAGEDGLWYFTLRPVMEAGAYYIDRPDDRAQMRRGPKRQTTSSPVSVSGMTARQTLSCPESELLFGGEGDGLLAQVYRLPPGGTVVGPAPRDSAGQFYVVLDGAMSTPDGALGEWEQLFLTADEAPWTITAADAGLEVLLLQFPSKARAYT